MYRVRITAACIYVQVTTKIVGTPSTVAHFFTALVFCCISTLTIAMAATAVTAINAAKIATAFIMLKIRNKR